MVSLVSREALPDFEVRFSFDLFPPGEWGIPGEPVAFLLSRLSLVSSSPVNESQVARC